MIKEALEYFAGVNQASLNPAVVKELTDRGFTKQVWDPGKKTLVEFPDQKPGYGFTVGDFGSLVEAYSHMKQHASRYATPVVIVGSQSIFLNFDAAFGIGFYAKMPVCLSDCFNSLIDQDETRFGHSEFVDHLRHDLFGVEFSPDLISEVRHLTFRHESESDKIRDKASASMGTKISSQVDQGDDLPDTFTAYAKPLAAYPEIKLTVSLECALHCISEDEELFYKILSGEKDRVMREIRSALVDRVRELPLDGIQIVQSNV